MSEFKREDRYIVLKLNRLAKDEAEYLRNCQAKAMVECVVVEHDWPEYHLVWAMIEHRMAGKPVPNFNDWRRADELQQRLTTADERVDTLEALLEQVLTNAERGLPPALHRALRELIPVQSATAPADEAERGPFEAWHRRRFATKHSTGEPTRDMHNGVKNPNYGPPNQQQMWEAWQARAALKPAEGGGDAPKDDFPGSTCNDIREEHGLPINKPCIACNGGACIDR